MEMDNDKKNRKSRRARRDMGYAASPRPASADVGRKWAEALEANVPKWCDAIKTVGRELKDCCVTISPDGYPYVLTRAETIDALVKLGRNEVAAAVRRASSNPDELLIVGMSHQAYVILYARNLVESGPAASSS
jgi:hypothetical protein